MLQVENGLVGVVKNKMRDIYRRGFKAEDFTKTKYFAGNLVVVKPVKPKDCAENNGLFLGDIGDLPSVACIAFTVVRAGDEVQTVKPGQVCMVRNAVLDPLNHDGDFLVIEASDIMFAWESGDLA